MSLRSNVSGTVFARPPAATDKYVPELDGIRAVAIAFVVTAHYHLFPFPFLADLALRSSSS